MTEQDPTRLAEQPAASPQIKGALEALGREGVGAERLARVAGKLASVLDAPAPALPMATRVWRFALRQLTAGKLTVALLMVGGALLFGSRGLPRPARPSAQSSQPDLVSPAPSLQVQPEVAVPNRPSDVVETPPAVSVVPAQRQPAKRRAPSAAAGAKTDPAQSTPLASAKHDSVVSSPLSAPEAKPSAVAPPVSERPAEPPLRPARTEAELLFEARKALADRPRAALELLDKHTQLYAHGQLAPEREVLAIEALRKLGKSDAAEARARRFRSEHPESFHLKGLE